MSHAKVTSGVWMACRKGVSAPGSAAHPAADVQLAHRLGPKLLRLAQLLRGRRENMRNKLSLSRILELCVPVGIAARLGGSGRGGCCETDDPETVTASGVANVSACAAW